MRGQGNDEPVGACQQQGCKGAQQIAGAATPPAASSSHHVRPGHSL